MVSGYKWVDVSCMCLGQGIDVDGYTVSCGHVAEVSPPAQRLCL